MSVEQTLYRKYRPSNFTDVVGQDAVVRVLESSIASGKIAHAYLFFGTRGTGKTSVARIFARELGVTPRDLYEIDAASNRGIDEIRELREAVHSLPYESPYKMYIIDEVHMLTPHAFNALLKTLEEPPRHALFILATTELDSVPETIISRCQTFAFKKPTLTDIRTILEKIVKAEKYEIEPEALTTLALLGEGSYRDAIGNLQKILSTTKGKKVTSDEVGQVTGAPKLRLVHDILEKVSERDLEGALELFANKDGINAKLLATLLLEHVRFAMLLAHAPGMKGYVAEQVSKEELEFLEKIGKKDPGFWPKLLRELLPAFEQFDLAAVPTLPLELALIRALKEIPA